MEIHLNALPCEVRSALLARKRGHGAAGCRFPQPGTPSHVFIVLFLICVSALIVATYMYVEHSFLVLLQVILVAVAGWSVIGLIRNYRQYRDSEFPGHCIFIDGSHFYLVRGHQVRAIRLDDVQNVSAYTRDKIHYLHLASANSHANLKMKTYLNRQRTLELAQVISRVKSFRNALPAQVKSYASGTDIWQAMSFYQAGDQKAMHEVLAKATLNGMAGVAAESGEGERSEPGPNVPRVYVTWRPWLVLVSLLGLLLVGGQWCNRLAYEAKLYHQVKRSNHSRYCATYLQTFPDGRFGDQVRELMDHRDFAAAEKALRRENRLGPMRAYLDQHSIHADEALAQIDSRYDEIFQRMEAKNSVLSEGLKRIIEKRKLDEYPVVSVMIDGRHDLRQGQKDFEALEQEIVMLRTKGLSLKPNGNGFLPNSLVIDPEPAFSNTEVAHRANLVKSRLEYGFNRGLGRELLSIQVVESESDADLVVFYEIKAVPFPYLFTQGGRALGMLRNFDVNWELTFRPLEKDQQALRWKTASEPSPQLATTSRSRLPHWTAYGVIIYSSFYGFSNDVLQGFGLPIEDPPEKFFTDQAISKYSGSLQQELDHPFEQLGRKKSDASDAELKRMIDKAVESARQEFEANKSRGK